MKRRRILLLLAVAVVAGIVLFWLRGPKEPVYQGRGITHWLNEVPATGLPEAREAARKAVRATSPDSRCFLMSEFTRHDPKWLVSLKVWLGDSADSYGVQSELKRMSRIETARVGLTLLGPEITPALPALVEYLGDDERGMTAALAMSGAGDAAIPFLLKGTASTNLVVAENAGHGIVALARETDSILPTLFQWLQHTNGGIRSIAVRALGASKSQTNWIVPALNAALSDQDLHVQRNAAVALKVKGPAAKAAIPALLRLMTNSSLDVAITASNAVFHIDPTALPQRPP